MGALHPNQAHIFIEILNCCSLCKMKNYKQYQSSWSDQNLFM